jgi:hypothetical protein
MALKAKATQEFVPIKEVRDGVIVLKDGGLRAIMLANSINLSLKSDDEQKATIMQFQNFLNTLDMRRSNLRWGPTLLSLWFFFSRLAASLFLYSFASVFDMNKNSLSWFFL